MQNFLGKREEHKYHSRSKHSKRIGALCCGSRPGVSSSSSSSSEEGIGKQLDCLSNLVHGMVQARREQLMIGERGPGIEGQRRDKIGAGSSGSSSRCIVLIAMDKSSYDPRGDFRRSMLDVITSKGLEEPKELRSLLNCYMSMNSREHRQVILEAFHEICSSIFLCDRRM